MDKLGDKWAHFYACGWARNGLGGMGNMEDHMTPEELADGSVNITADHARRLNADVDAWEAVALARPRAAVGEHTVADSQRDFIAAIVAGAPKGEATIVEYTPDGSGWSVYDRAKHPVEFFGFALVDRAEFAARVLWADGQTRLGQSVSDLPRSRTDFRNRARELLAEHPALALQSPPAKE